MTYNIWQSLITNNKLPKELKYIDTHKYKADLTKTPVNFYKKTVKSIKTNMNTAINLHVKSYTSEKVYNLKIFSKGKIVVAGLLNPYE